MPAHKDPFSPLMGQWDAQVRNGGQLGKLRLRLAGPPKLSKSQQMSGLARTPDCDNRPPCSPRGSFLGNCYIPKSETFLLTGTPQASVSEQVSARSYFKDHVFLPLGPEKRGFFFFLVGTFESKWPLSVS